MLAAVITRLIAGTSARFAACVQICERFANLRVLFNQKGHVAALTDGWMGCFEPQTRRDQLGDADTVKVHNPVGVADGEPRPRLFLFRFYSG